MKLTKVFSIIALSAMTLAANALPVNSVQINITGETGAAEGTLNIAQTSGANVPFVMVTDGNPINVWAIVGSNQYSTYYNATAINGTAIGFKGNSNTNYTMTFDYVGGTIKLYDAELDSVIVVEQGGTYVFAATADSIYAVRFQVGEPAAPVYKREAAINTWGTICYPKAINGITGAEVYELTKVVGNDVYGEQVTACEAGKSYVFKATADGEQLFAYTGAEVGAPVETTGMVGNFGPAEIDVPAGMYGINGTSVMEVAAGTKLKANRAYIDVEELRAVQAPARGRKIFNVATTPTGFEAVEAAGVKDGKVMMNGKLVIIRDGKMFNAQGQEL